MRPPQPKLTWQWRPEHIIRWWKRWKRSDAVEAITIIGGIFGIMLAVMGGGMIVSTWMVGAWPLVKILAFTASEYLPLILTIIGVSRVMGFLHRHPPIKRELRESDRQELERLRQLERDYEEGRLQ